ncbi:hypothetical protein GOM49_05525 [Clostridium bovifaecis]|uniref:Uncharacterized protein n=1 Tax=Clostridium bovifaecis TaxID=2184719 RepID=A0A6I6EQD8_9CLOT|nr:hypothetical protein GOM49_05525 [Clostridium bovifaecis]
MIALKVLIAFTMLCSIKYIVSVRNNPFYNKSSDFIGSSTNYINTKIN